MSIIGCNNLMLDIEKGIYAELQKQETILWKDKTSELIEELDSANKNIEYLERREKDLEEKVNPFVILRAPTEDEYPVVVFERGKNYANICPSSCLFGNIIKQELVGWVSLAPYFEEAERQQERYV